MQMKLIHKVTIFFSFLLPVSVFAQVNMVEFGKNRVQYNQFKWKFYQSPNFNTYVTQGGTALGKFVSQVAEDNLPELEKFTEYSLQRRANIVVYNSYDDFKQSNIGLGIDWQNAGGLTKLVNNKIVVYFDGNHNHLRNQIREGIAKVLTDNILFGDDIGEFASNQALLDLPQWLTDGYVAYAAENWSTEKDDQLKSAMLSGKYNNFYQFAFDKPLLAGNAFWYYIAEHYRKENVTYFLYMARIYKSLNSASEKICKKKFKEVLDDFMQQMQDRYYKDIRQRRNAPKGVLSVSEDVSKNDYFRFQANPNPRSNNYAVVEFKKGVYKVKYVENFYDTKVLLDYGVRTNEGDINPNYPILAWDGKGTRLLVIYWDKGKIKMFVYDVLARYKRYKQDITGFEQIIDASFMLDANTLILSAVKNGQTDLFIYKIDDQKVEQITNDVYDELYPSFVSFPNRSGIIFSSNRPSPNAPSNDTVLPSRYRFNIFLVDILNKSKTKQITQLTNLKYGNAKYPMQYNTNHFTYVSDENGIANRWAGFFSTQREGLDTLYYIGTELLRNPSTKELDSTLAAWRKPEADSISYFQVYKDSTYTFPITNYQSSLLESRVSGNNDQVSETRQEGDFKYLYKLKVDATALNRRNVNARPTQYMQEVMQADKIAQGKPLNFATNNNKNAKKQPVVVDTVRHAPKNFFQNEFANDTTSAANSGGIAGNAGNSDLGNATESNQQHNYIQQTKLFNYRLKFSADYLLAGVTNNILVNRFQPYAGGAGPIQLNNGSAINWSFRAGVSDLMEDIKFIGGIRFGTTLKDKDFFFSFQNLKHRVDWGITYYRSTQSNFFNTTPYDNQLYTNLYQFNVAYPFDQVRSLRATFGLRKDLGVIKPADQFSLNVSDTSAQYLVGHIEYVYDNTINPAQNIWNGLRWKVYFDMTEPIAGTTGGSGNQTYNVGFDARNYFKIYRNFIWATRAAGDFSFGNQKIIYYLGGTDGWVNPKFNSANQPAPDQTYAFQSLALNMRGYNQNVANGNNAVVINSELRLPLFSTLFNKPINNAFLRNFQVIQFIDLGTAWNGKFNGIQRPTEIFPSPNPQANPINVRIDAGGLGPFAGGYGFGVRSTLLGYFIRADLGWPMKGVFRGPSVFYLSLGLDF
jgi:hypothetical protein